MNYWNSDAFPCLSTCAPRSARGKRASSEVERVTQTEKAEPGEEHQAQRDARRGYSRDVPVRGGFHVELPKGIRTSVVEFALLFIWNHLEACLRCQTLTPLRVLFDAFYLVYVRKNLLNHCPSDLDAESVTLAELETWRNLYEQQSRHPWRNTLFEFLKWVNFDTCLWTLSSSARILPVPAISKDPQVERVERVDYGFLHVVDKKTRGDAAGIVWRIESTLLDTWMAPRFERHGYEDWLLDD